MKKIVSEILLLVMLLMGFAPLMTLAADSPIGWGTSIGGSSAIKSDPMPEDVSKQAAGEQKKAASEAEKQDIAKKKSACLATNPGQTSYCDCVANGGVKLNTDVPFVGKCINKDDTPRAFPDLIQGLSKMVVTAILIVGFLFIIIGGVQWASGNPKEWKEKIVKVAIWLAILGASGAILNLINPNFFQ